MWAQAEKASCFWRLFTISTEHCWYFFSPGSWECTNWSSVCNCAVLHVLKLCSLALTEITLRVLLIQIKKKKSALVKPWTNFDFLWPQQPRTDQTLLSKSTELDHGIPCANEHAVWLHRRPAMWCWVCNTALDCPTGLSLFYEGSSKHKNVLDCWYFLDITFKALIQRDQYFHITDLKKPCYFKSCLVPELACITCSRIETSCSSGEVKQTELIPCPKEASHSLQSSQWWGWKGSPAEFTAIFSVICIQRTDWYSEDLSSRRLYHATSFTFIQTGTAAVYVCKQKFSCFSKGQA